MAPKSMKVVVAEALAKGLLQAVKDAIAALQKSVETQEALAYVMVENTKALHRIERLLDEQSDLVVEQTETIEDKVVPALAAVGNPAKLRKTKPKA